MKPPSRPTVTNRRTSSGTRNRPSPDTSPANSTMANEPATFTASVPHGNAAPNSRSPACTAA